MLLSLFFLMTISFSGYSQPPLNYWKLGGNPITGVTNDVVDTTNNFFGTNSGIAVPVKLGANGNQNQLYLSPITSGIVGIGTTTPTEKLDVDGKIRMRTGGISGFIPVSDANGVMTWTNPTTITTADDGDWTISGNDVYRANGNVGIGNTAPTARLHVMGINNSSSDFGLKIQNGSGGNLFSVRNDGAIQVGVPGGTGTVNMFCNNGIDMQGEIILKNNVGKIGLHLTNQGTGNLVILGDPTWSLRIESPVRSNVVLGNSEASFVQGAGNEKRGVILHIPDVTLFYNNTNPLNTAAAVSLGTPTFASVQTTVITKAAALYLNGSPLAGAGTTISERYTLLIGSGNSRFDGNVGIGVAPSEKLTVAGTVFSTTGGFKFPDGTVQTTAASGSPQWTTSGNDIYNSNIGNVGIGTTTPTENLHVLGNILASGSITPFSDQRFKKDINRLENSLEKVLKLRGVNYYMNTEKFPKYHFSDKKQIGFIAQEVEKVLPELVIAHKDGYKSLDYMKITPLLVEAIKEQQAIIEKQAKQIEEHSRHIEEIKTYATQSNKADDFYSETLQTTDKKQENGIVLYQNKPNPFTENTVIQYKIPSTVNEASVLIFDMQGKQLKKYENLKRGESSIVINGGELYMGMFIYSLIVDGKEVAIKRMILTE